MLIPSPTTLTVDTIDYVVVSRNATSSGNSFGMEYITPAKNDANPVFRTKYDLSKPLAQRKLFQCVGTVVANDGVTRRNVTVNLSVVHANDVDDADVEHVIAIAKGAYGLANFGANVVDGIA
jgi:hypothetical protein